MLVLVHGYGGGGAIFYKMIKDLASRFHVYLVDLLGMGSSGRPEFPLRQACMSVQVAEDFFVNALYQWKERLGLRDKFVLAGHSFGGYISSVYAMRYPEQLSRLILISPVGVPEKPDSYSQEHFSNNFDSMASRVAAKVIYRMWERNYTPFHVLRWGGKLGTQKFLKKYMQHRMERLTHQEEVLELRNYLHQVFLRPASGEYALNCIL